jgi:hypothetical protein
MAKRAEDDMPGMGTRARLSDGPALLFRILQGLLIYLWDLSPELFPSLATAVTNVKRNDLASCGVHSHPELLLVHLSLHKTPHLIGFGFQPSNHHVGWTIREPDM